MSSATAVVPQVAAPLHLTAVSHSPYLHTWCALQRNPCSTSLGRRKKRFELGLNLESGPIGAPVRWAPDSSPMWVIGPHRASSNSRSDGLLCLMRADAARCAILAEADDGSPDLAHACRLEAGVGPSGGHAAHCDSPRCAGSVLPDSTIKTGVWGRPTWSLVAAVRVIDGWWWCWPD